MTRDDQFIEQLEGYLDEYEGHTPLPDAVRTAVRARVPTTRQVGSVPRPIKLLRTSMSVPAPIVYGLVAAAVVAAVVLGNAFLGGGLAPRDNIGAHATPSALAPTRIAPNEQPDLAAGVYYVDAPFPVHLQFEVPEGMGVFLYTAEGSQINLGDGTTGEVSFEIVDNISADPCTDRLLDPPVGPYVDHLVTALSSLPGFDATPATRVTIDGFHGMQFTLTAPDGVAAPCQSMRTWTTTTRQNAVGPGEINEVTILDVDGVRLLIGIADSPRTSPADWARLQAIVDSVQLNP